MKLFFSFIPLIFLAATANAAYQTPNMGLTIPVPGVDTGPNWANEINASLTLLDAHDHSPGKGVPITPNGINITSNLPMNGNFLTTLGAEVFQVQSANPTPNACLYSKGVDLYYKDGGGNVIQITANGGVSGTPGSISNLTAPASASFVSASGTYVWQSGTSIPASMDASTYILRYAGSYPNPSGSYIALEAPTSLAAGYAVTFPTAPPSPSPAFVTMGIDGTLSDSVSTAGGIVSSNIAAGTIAASRLAAPIGSHQVFSSGGTYTVPAGATLLNVLLIGGGGGGGGGVDNTGDVGGSPGSPGGTTTFLGLSTVFSVGGGLQGSGGIGNPGFSAFTGSITAYGVGYGAGGAGGASGYPYYKYGQGGSGSPGQNATFTVAVTPGDTWTVIVGSGGAGGAAGGYGGGNGAAGTNGAAIVTVVN